MGRLANMVNTNLFRKKKSVENCDTSHVSSVTFNTLTHESSLDVASSDIGSDSDSIRLDGSIRNTTKKMIDELPPTGNHLDVKLLPETINSENIEEKIYELERCYLFEQNNVIDRYEVEKSDMLVNHEEEKRLMKRAFEHEKSELLKEIERKDKIIFESTSRMKSESKFELEKQKEYYQNLLQDKQSSFAEIESRLHDLVDRLKHFVDNNEAVASVINYKEFLCEYDRFSSSFSQTSRRNITKLKTDSAQTDLSVKNPDKQTADCGDTDSNKPIKCVTSVSDNVRISDNEHSGKHRQEFCGVNGDETSIQHELAQAYRKQKCELMKLLNSEKEDYEQCLKREKENFEKDVRAEYVNRMAIERKAWQETIEDYEREIAILKYERLQMDRNYCIGVDMLKTEFEREKNTIYRRYNESCERLKEEFVKKNKNSKIASDVKDLLTSPRGAV